MSKNWKCLSCGSAIWNRYYYCHSCAVKGRKNPMYGIKKMGKDNFNYGNLKENINYQALHQWVRRELGKPQECVFCGECIKKLEWASVSHNAKRDLNDYISLCISCHRKYDHRKIYNWGVVA